MLSEQRVATKENVTRKQARTAGEKEDSEEEDQPSESDDEDDDDIPYNPKNLPLGWDGKVKDWEFFFDLSKCKILFF
jgi:splicing factor 3A subunit 3